MVSLDGLKHWAKDRPKTTAGIGGGLVLLVAAAVLLLGRGEDLAPVVGGTPADPASQATEAATGQLVADEPGAQNQEAAIEGGASGAAGGSTVAPITASKGDRDAAYANEQTMNDGLSAPPSLTPSLGTAPVSSPPTTDEDVAFVGRKLEIAADQVDQCMAAGEGDVFECLGKLPDGLHVERIYETDPQGARITVTGAEGVVLMFRGGTRCRILGTSEDCNGWSATSG